MLTELQLKWLDGVKSGKNYTEAAVDAGYTDNRKSAAVIGARLAKHPKIKKILDKTEENLRDKFREEAERAFLVILAMVDDKKVSPKVRLDACRDILDRAGYNPTQKQELIGHVTFEAKAIETAKRARLIASSSPIELLEEGNLDASHQVEWVETDSDEA